ncbi:YiiX/YebB-like N1pC/P60 family cysteine hydrolase [Aliarcobacter cryaerophilus]|uniref:YiiX/YebB-like N1pC/P60 family cysteine hydrolase n=1 Tax=Aliarcobacter cryaerophilus TaxID=28198 RepID=UPI0021B303DE|nr:YiiX/YebB-like N1pC/P60 family cysteine hydrolase [Aliarcobacter cryaerophilus]MCT7484776.1 YiiX/YebB-like N1pC/P60 family cysteine hydrolase [Aliarcobacter cryaerophilus]
MFDSTIGEKYIINYKDLLPGDIILESGKKIHSKVIQIYTKSHYSHVMICLMSTSLFHAQSEGIFTLNPQRVLVEEENDLKVLRPKKKLSEKESENIIKFLRNKVGTLYSVKEAIISGKKIRPESSQSQMQFCSRLVAQAYLHIGHKIVENPNFCQPAEIENSNFFEEVPDIIRKATKEEIEFVSTKNFVLENQISTYKWLNNTRDYAKSEFGYEKIHSQNDVMNFLKEYPEADNIVSGYINESGYLENYKIEKDNNPWLFDVNLFIKKYKSSNEILYAINKGFENIQYYIDRTIKNYLTASQNFEDLKFNYFKLEENLHKNRLDFIINKYTTFIKASEYVLKETIKDKNHNLFSIVSNKRNILNEEKKKLEELLI